MTSKMTHAEWVAKRRARVGLAARRALDGEISILEAAREIWGIGHSCELPEDDADLAVISLVECETDALPIGDERANWAADALVRHQPEVERAEAWAWSVAEEALRSLARRFGTSDN